jgi:hypothetical protein
MFNGIRKYLQSKNLKLVWTVMALLSCPRSLLDDCLEEYTVHSNEYV